MERGHSLLNISPYTLLALATMSGTPLAAAQPGDCSQWEHFPAPGLGDEFNILYAVSDTSTSDVWAVGRADFASGSPLHRTLAMHWNGAAWSIWPTPNPSITFNWNDLGGVVALAPDDVWAVGTHNPDTGGPSQTLVMHFDGQSWQLAPSPVGSAGSSFFDITAVGDELWAVGAGGDPLGPPFGFPSMAARKRGGGDWEVTFTPTFTIGRQSDILAGVSGTSPSDVWAVGRIHPQVGGTWHAYAMRWDGSAWARSPFQTPGADDSLEDVVALAPDDVWAAGYWYDLANAGTQPLIMHFDGSSWEHVILPRFDGGRAELRTIAARSATEIYAAGTHADANGRPRPLILGYDGEAWSVMTPAQTDGSDEWFRGMGEIPGGDVWAVGQYYTGAGLGLTERLAVCCRADFDHDGFVTGQDFDAFVGAFEAGDLSADFDGDGFVTGLDFDAYVAAFEVGC